MFIRIKNTTFGLMVNGVIKPKTPKDPPFEVPDELACRLISEGFAERSEEQGFPDNPGYSSDDSYEENEFAIPKYNAKTSKANLQAIAEKYGVALPKDAKSEDIIRVLDDFFADALPESEE